MPTDRDMQTYPLRRPRLTDNEYTWAYRLGWAASNRASDLGQAEVRFENRYSPTPAQADAWEDGWLDVAAGRKKYHLMYCTTHDTTC